MRAFTTSKTSLPSWLGGYPTNRRGLPRPAIRTNTEALGSLPSNMAKALSGMANLGTLSSPLVVTGKSGVRHTFTFGLGSIESPTVAGDIVISTAPVDETKVLSLFIKVYDVSAKNSILCVAPSLTPDAKKLSSLYKIFVVEAPSESEILTRLSDILPRLVPN